MFKNIGHFIASIGIGIWDSLTGKPTNGTAAEAIGAGIGNILGATVPEARPLINAAVTGYGDLVQAVKAQGKTFVAGQPVTIIVSEALASASQVIWPDIEKTITAFEQAIGPSSPTPVSNPPAAS